MGSRVMLLTRDDLIRSGACAEGVTDWCSRRDLDATALDVDALLKLASQSERKWIESAAGLRGYGYGDCKGSANG